MLLIWKTFQNKEEWCFPFWNIFFCFRDILCFFIMQMRKVIQTWMGFVGLIAQLVEHCTGIAEDMGSNLIQAWIIFRLNFTTTIISHVFIVKYCMYWLKIQLFLKPYLTSAANVLGETWSSSSDARKLNFLSCGGQCVNCDVNCSFFRSAKFYN